jgi:hypothetical protein
MRGVLQPLWDQKGGGAPGGDSARVSQRRRCGRAAGGGRRRGGARTSVRERDELGRADREAKAKRSGGKQASRRPRPRRLGQKPELGPIQEIKLFEFYLKFRILANFGNLHKKI